MVDEVVGAEEAERRRRYIHRLDGCGQRRLREKEVVPLVAIVLATPGSLPSMSFPPQPLSTLSRLSLYKPVEVPFISFSSGQFILVIRSSTVDQMYRSIKESAETI